MRAEDVARLLVDASGSGAVAAQWKELRGLSAKRKGQEQQLPIVYLNEDADAQTRAIRGVKLRVQELMETSRVSTAAALEADSASLESDDEYDNTEVPFHAPWAAEGKEIERPSAVPPLPISTNTNFQQRTTTILSPKLEQTIEFSAFSSWCVGGDVPYGELLRRLNPIPSRSEEAGTVISLAQSACRRGLVEGSVWCVLSNRWWQSWLDYTGRYEDILLALGPVSNEVRTPTEPRVVLPL